MTKEKAFLGVSSTLANGSGKAHTTAINPKSRKSRIRFLATMTLSNCTPLLAVLVLVFHALPTQAQFGQYVLPGEQLTRTPADKETLERAMEAVPFRLGGIRWGTYLALRNIQYVDNVFGTATNKTSDVTASVAAGVHAYLLLGKRFLVGAYGVPSTFGGRSLTGGGYGTGDTASRFLARAVAFVWRCGRVIIGKPFS